MTSRLLPALGIALAVLFASPAFAEECTTVSLWNKGTYILHLRAYDDNEKCSAVTKYDVAGAGTASMDIVRGNTVSIKGLLCNSDFAKCDYTFVCDNDKNKCDDIVCDGVFPGSLHCRRN